MNASRFAILLRISGLAESDIAWGQKAYIKLESSSSARVSKHMLNAYDYQEDERMATRRVSRLLEPLAEQMSKFPIYEEGNSTDELTPFLLRQTLEQCDGRIALDAVAERLWEACRKAGLLG